ncbi:hypothetical protein EUGRSUZ_H02583 [Eucalyptus grandis]|uniref:Uncharacterized protein n=2 Tax=Eucalyptus grandis TaxID=71139 RepID=A0ACC3JS55_EUCGR|nr:hypothetical protein EUGRSUZ_H02583 [Eucalyptus grandis]
MSNPQRNQHARNGDQSGMQDHVSIYVQNILHGVPTARPEHSIFRVRRQLRGVNEKAYEPEILAIGPYHSGNDKFKFMEEQKLRYVKRLLWRRREGSVDKYMPALRSMEQWARDCYAEAVDLSQENFLAMMLIDGLFLVELFRKNSIKELRDEDDPVMKEDWIRFCLPRDLVLLENQIPFLILEELYGLTKGPEEHSELIDVATRYLNFQHRPSGEVNYMTDYVTFMDCLIDSSTDVELLRAAGIIKNYMGDDEAVAQMFNKMGDYVTLSNFYYDDIFRRLNAHCKKRWNRSMAKLRREHLHSPWALLSISAATMLLLLTVAQTVLTYLAYRNEGKKG